MTAAVAALLSGLVSNLLGATVLGVAGAHDPDARESSDQAAPPASPRPATAPHPATAPLSDSVLAVASCYKLVSL